MASETWRRWRPAMQDALYGPDGFYLRTGAPGQGFRTSAHAGRSWHDAIAELAWRADRALGQPEDFTVVDIGAGEGEVLGALAAHAPDRWSLVAVDVAPRPHGLPPRIQWRSSPPPATSGLLLAVEWLDVVPLDVVVLTEDGPRYVEVSTRGAERTGDIVVCRADLDWLERWWPLAETGHVVEIGRTRDDAWAAATSTLARGFAVLVDYAADPGRDQFGTMTAYADGRQVNPIPDGSCDLTAHVRLESLTQPGDLVVSQHDALRMMGAAPERPKYDGDPAAYLHALAATSEAAELLDRYGFGAFTWLLHGRGCDPALLLQGE